MGLLRGTLTWNSHDVIRLFAVYGGLQDLFCHQEQGGTVFSGSQSKNFEMKSTSRGLKRHND